MIFGKKQENNQEIELESRLPHLFSALSDKRRFEIVKLLNERTDLCVSQIADVFRITVSAASQQLKQLEMAGLVRKIRDGQKICYEIKHEDLLVQKLLNLIR